MTTVLNTVFAFVLLYDHETGKIEKLCTGAAVHLEFSQSDPPGLLSKISCRKRTHLVLP